QPTQPQQRTPQQPIQQQGQQYQSPPSNRSEEFNKLFYKASSVDAYHEGYYKLQNSNQDPKKFIESNFSLNGSAVNSVTFFEKAQVESRQKVYLWGTQERSTEKEGKKEVVLIGQDVSQAQNNMFEEYFKNAKEILELEAKYGATNLPDDLKELFAINANKDFNFLVKDANGTNTVNSPLVQRLYEIKAKIGGTNLGQGALTREQNTEIERKANAYAKDLLVAQVKNNCLYTGDGTTNNPYKEAKRINIFRGKKDFKTGESVIEVKFGSSCEEGDFALIPVGDKDLNLFCKVLHQGDGKEAELQYFKKDNNELKLIKYDVYFSGSNLTYEDDGSSVLQKKEIIDAINKNKFEVSWVGEVSNSTNQLSKTSGGAVSTGGSSDNSNSQVDNSKIKSFGSQNIVVKQQSEIGLESRNTSDWWNNKMRKPFSKFFETPHSDEGFSIKKNDNILFSNGKCYYDVIGIKKEILASEHEIDVKIDTKTKKIKENNLKINIEENPDLAKAMRILEKLEFDNKG
ncbi:MAG: hypothetical protein ACKN9I_02415, partial [Alphaproteobacteria bacterium]